MKEEWKDIYGYEGLYKISNLGEIKSLERKVNYNNIRKITVHERIIKQRSNGGYKEVSLSKNNKGKNLSVHRLVAIHFIPNPYNKKEVNHIDGNKSNNNIHNLEWVTPSKNVRHSYDMGLARNDGENHPTNKLTESDVM